MKAIQMLAAGSACMLLASCSSNPLSIGYRSVPGAGKREWVNPNPSLVRPSMSNHGSTVSNYTRKGYHVIGYGQINARYQVDAENARMLGIENNADVAVFSRSYLGKQTETVQVPVMTAATSQSSQYANSNQYASDAQAQSQTTIYQYKDQKYDLWAHKTTLLRK